MDFYYPFPPEERALSYAHPYNFWRDTPRLLISGLLISSLTLVVCFAGMLATFLL